MANVIVGIHGLSNKPDKETLSRWWEAAIREGLEKNCNVRDADFEYVQVYWADLLYKYPQHHDGDFDFDSLYDEQIYTPATPGTLKKYKERWLDDARATVVGAGGAALEAVRGYVGLDNATDWLRGMKMKDLAFYYDRNRRIRGRDGQLEIARRVLMDELTNTMLPLRDRRIMLIAHSMGTIIGYDALRDLGRRDRQFAVPHFVTIGSPLGLPHVKTNIHSDRTYSPVPLRTPSVVTERWVNYADRRDPVALDIHLRDDFGPNDAGVRVEDDIIINDYVNPVDKDRNTHKSFGYLRTPELSEHIRDFLRP